MNDNVYVRNCVKCGKALYEWELHMGYCEKCEEKAYKIMKFLPIFYDMEWEVDHAFSTHKCSRCGRLLHVCSDVSTAEKDNTISRAAYQCENCGETINVECEGIIEKVVQSWE